MEFLNTNYSRQFTIQQLSEKLDIPKPTLRFWEKELEGIIVPHRTPGGQRRYSEKHVELLEEIKNLRNSGKSLDEIKLHLDKGNGKEKMHGDYDSIDLLLERITEVVKSEINHFLKK